MIRWEEVSSRVRASEAALQGTLGEDPQRIAAAYRRRAILLASEPSTTESTALGVPVLIFRVGQERYAIKLHELAEVLPFSRSTELPNGAPHWRGLMNVRGEVRPVADLGVMLSGDPSGPVGFVLMLRRNNVGLKVDNIEELNEVSLEGTGADVGRHHVIAQKQGTLALLDIDHVLSTLFPQKEL
jgi:chemotaxis signal transduction protein